MSCAECGRKCQRFGKHRNGLRRFRCPNCRKTYTEPHKRTLGTMYTPKQKALLAVQLLLEGNSIRSTERISTSHVERQNLTMRMQIRRLTRLTNAFSKKWENHWAALCLHFAYYNFCRVHTTLRVTPAMESGLTDHVWTISELLSA